MLMQIIITLLLCVLKEAKLLWQFNFQIKYTRTNPDFRSVRHSYAPTKIGGRNSNHNAELCKTNFSTALKTKWQF